MDETAALRKEVKKYIDKADDKTLQIVYHLLEAYDTNDLLNNIDEAQETSLKRSLEQADKGQVIPHTEIMKKYSKWLKQ